MSNSLAGLVASWAAWYGDSLALSTAVTILHLAGMLLGGGLAIAGDRATLRALGSGNELADHLDSLEAVHRLVLAGLGLTGVTGVALVLADLDTFIRSPVFWVKMGLLLGLLGNGAGHRAAARGLRSQLANPRLRRRLRITAWVSGTLWFGLLGLGATLPAL